MTEATWKLSFWRMLFRNENALNLRQAIGSSSEHIDLICSTLESRDVSCQNAVLAATGDARARLTNTANVAHTLTKAIIVLFWSELPRSDVISEHTLSLYIYIYIRLYNMSWMVSRGRKSCQGAFGKVVQLFESEPDAFVLGRSSLHTNLSMHTSAAWRLVMFGELNNRYELYIYIQGEFSERVMVFRTLLLLF